MRSFPFGCCIFFMAFLFYFFVCDFVFILCLSFALACSFILSSFDVVVVCHSFILNTLNLNQMHTHINAMKKKYHKNKNLCVERTPTNILPEFEMNQCNLNYVRRNHKLPHKICDHFLSNVSKSIIIENKYLVYYFGCTVLKMYT